MAIDYEAFRETLLSRNKITAERHAEYLEDEDALPNDISEGKNVLSLGWDGNAPGCSGAIWVKEWMGFYFCSSSDYDDEGPFQSLDEALEMEWFSTDTSNPELDSDVLPLEQLLGIGRGLVSEEMNEIYINGSLYHLEGGELVKSKTEE